MLQDNIIIWDNPIKLKTDKALSGRTPHDFQEKAIQKLEKSFITDNKQAGLLQIPTGGGKTYTAVRWIFESLMHNRGYKLVWIAHRIDLLEQARQTMIEESGLLKGIPKPPKLLVIGGGYSKGTTLATAKEDILLLSFQTIAKEQGERAIKKLCEKNDKSKILFVIDEAHHSAAGTYKFIINEYILKHNYKLLGLTATPTRTVEKERAILWNLFDNNLLFEIEISELIKKGILAIPKPESISTKIDLEKSYKITDKTREYFESKHELDPDFLRSIAAHVKRNKIIVGTYDKNKYGKTLVFAIDIKHCISLYHAFKEHNGLRVDYTYSGLEGHAEKIQKFKKNELDILINVSKLTEGFDDPKIETIFLTRPTQSEILFSQMIGRGLRGGEKGTKYVNLVSFEDHWEQFTGWLDTQKITEILGIEDPELEKKLLKPQTKKVISSDVIEELHRQLSSLNIPGLSDSLSFECWPVGWYTIPDEDDETKGINAGISPTRTIIVFSHQKQSWEELCEAIKRKKPTPKEINKVYADWFEDLPAPRVSKELVKIFIDSCYITGNFINPEFFTLNEREEASPDKLSKFLYDKPWNGQQRKDYINKWYEKYSILSDIYSDVETFTEAIDKATRRIEYPEKYNPEIPQGEQYIKTEKLGIIIPPTDNKKLHSFLSKLKTDKNLFPEGYSHNPDLEWTIRPMKSYFGIAYIDRDRNKIKINRILNSPQIEQNEELIRFILYHEMLHFSLGRKHDKVFRQIENKYDKSDELNSILDRVSIEYNIEYFNKTKKLYSKKN